MNFEMNREVGLHRDLERISGINDQLTSIGERLSAVVDESNALGERSKLFHDLCGAYDGIVPYEADAGHWKNFQASTEVRLCSSIDALLDQLSNADFKSRLWTVKAELVFEQVQALGRSALRSLHSTILPVTTLQPAALPENYYAPAQIWDRIAA